MKLIIWHFFNLALGTSRTDFSVHYSNENDPYEISKRMNLIIWDLFNLDMGSRRMCPLNEIIILQI